MGNFARMNGQDTCSESDLENFCETGKATTQRFFWLSVVRKRKYSPPGLTEACVFSVSVKKPEKAQTLHEQIGNKISLTNRHLSE